MAQIDWFFTRMFNNKVKQYICNFQYCRFPPPFFTINIFILKLHSLEIIVWCATMVYGKIRKISLKFVAKL